MKILKTDFELKEVEMILNSKDIQSILEGELASDVVTKLKSLKTLFED